MISLNERYAAFSHELRTQMLLAVRLAGWEAALHAYPVQDLVAPWKCDDHFRGLVPWALDMPYCLWYREQHGLDKFRQGA
jgi:hypothetical protein